MGKTEELTMSWRERKKGIKHNWLRPLIYLEWCCERLSNLLGRWAFLEILGHIGRLAILFALISYIMEADERRMQAENQRKAKHYQAWQVINSAHGKRSSGGRIDALQDLNKDKVSLRGVDVSNAYLTGINLKDADLVDANLSGAGLFEANLSGVYLDFANLRGADLEDADLSRANLEGASLAGANLRFANLSNAYLPRANLSGANLWKVNLYRAVLSSANLYRAELWRANLSDAVIFGAKCSGADLCEANLTGADLSDANLTGADLSWADLSGADMQLANIFIANLSGANLCRANLSYIREWRDVNSIEFANIYDVNNPPDGFIEWAKEHGAVMIESRDEWEAFLEEERDKKRNVKMP